MQKKIAIVVGNFIDPARQVWSPNANAFDSFVEAIETLGTKDSYFDDLAYELHTTRGELEKNIESVDNVSGLNALVQVLQTKPNVAVRTFRTIREANSFLDLIEQMAEKREKEKQKRRIFLQN